MRMKSCFLIILIQFKKKASTLLVKSYPWQSIWWVARYGGMGWPVYVPLSLLVLVLVLLQEKNKDEMDESPSAFPTMYHRFKYLVCNCMLSIVVHSFLISECADACPLTVGCDKGVSARFCACPLCLSYAGKSVWLQGVQHILVPHGKQRSRSIQAEAYYMHIIHVIGTL